ncbi:hypothetical protein AX16_008745 [Volvariella volvacea WC 439]|nr:hypothetical protein AX16_008745 [Volvariella volvacea WC 439]
MNSVTGNLQEEKQKQLELRRQIASLQAQLKNIPDIDEDEIGAESSKGSKRKEAEENVLVPATPSPKKKRKVIHDESNAQAPRLSAPNFTSNSSKSPFPSSSKNSESASVADKLPNKPPPSNLLQKLSKIPKRLDDDPAEEPETAVKRTTGFRQRPVAPPESGTTTAPTSERDEDENADTTATTTHGIKRDDRLAIIQEFEIGPKDHKPPFDDPLFEKLEPNSGIRLSSRKLPHTDFQEYLYGRYYLSPSNLYSSIRLQPDKQSYDVPVPGDWITIAVVAERGPIRWTKAPIGIGPDEDGVGDKKGSGGAGGWKGKTEGKVNGASGADGQGGVNRGGKRYVNFKLVDFGARSRGGGGGGASESGAGKSVIRGDAHLSLLLFESDGFEVMFQNMDLDEGSDEERDEGDAYKKPRGKGIEVGTRKKREDGNKEVKYKGGSGGAFEQLYKLTEGDVIAILNPRILKPLQRNATPHPTTNILALTPTSSSSLEIIGRSLDFGRCTAMKRDGKRCTSWVDKRLSDVCEWHLQNAVERRRAARSEFAVGTSGLSTTAVHKRFRNGGSSSSTGYDPSRQWGLTPESNFSSGPSDGATYVVSGHIVRNSSSSGSGPGGLASGLFVAENLGREGQARARRKMEQKEGDMKVLRALMERDREGMRDVVAAREAFDRKRESGGEGKVGVGDKGKGKGKEKDTGTDKVKEEKKANSVLKTKTQTTMDLGVKGYSANVIKGLGFDPSLKVVGGSANGRHVSSDIQKKLDALQRPRKEVDLGPRPGPKVRSGVNVSDEKIQERRRIEAEADGGGNSSAVGEGFIDLDSDE